MTALLAVAAGLVLPRLAGRSLASAHVVDHLRDTKPAVDAKLLGLPIHVLSFDVTGDAGATILLVSAVLLVGLGLHGIFAERKRCLPIWWLLLFQGGVGSVFALSRVSLNPDPTAYILYARLYGVFGVNPYRLPIAVPNDAMLHVLASLWGPPVLGDVYGPLWTLLVAGIAHLQAQSSLMIQWVTQRLIAVVAAMITAWGIFRLVRRGDEKSRALSRVANFAFHPFVLLQTAINGHNDMVMVAFAVWACVMVEEAAWAAGLLFGASIAVKFASVALLPFPRFSALMTILHLRRQFLSVKPWLVIPICQQTG